MTETITREEVRNIWKQHELTPEEKRELIDEIEHLRVERGAVILAHNYQIPEIQDLADFIGDSLGLSQEAARTDSDLIIFCGVHFMAETAAIISPQKRVLIPDLDAGCSLASSIDYEKLKAWKYEHPNAVVVSYVNTTAEVKALTDYCCTSTNAVQVVNSIPADKDILFLPDMFLGAYVKRVTERDGDFHIWPGECHVHAGIRPEDIDKKMEEHQDAEMLVHPECGCSTSCMYQRRRANSRRTFMFSQPRACSIVRRHPLPKSLSWRLRMGSYTAWRKRQRGLASSSCRPMSAPGAAT